MNRTRLTCGILVVIIGFLILCSQLPITRALKFGNDEGYEMMKGFLCSKGYKLYTQIWNDQPPVQTMILAAAFRSFGATLPVARLVAATFGLLLYCSLFLITGRSNLWIGLLAVFFLAASPGILLLSLSMMLEVPTFAIALFSVYCLFRWSDGQRNVWLWISGVIMGIALGSKLTAVLTVPAILLEIALATLKNKAGWQKCLLISSAQWIGATLLTFTLIMLLWGKGSLQCSFQSHFVEQAVPGLPRPEDYPFPFGLIKNHFECVVAAIVGIVLVAKRRLWRQFAFPLTLLATSLTIHLIHRPCWDYYYLHLAIPLAWLSAYAIYEAILWSSAVLAKIKSPFASAGQWVGIAVCVIAALVVLRSERRLEGGIIDIRSRPATASDPIVTRLKQYADPANWVYCEEPIYAFAAGCLCPPELAVVCAKRFWSRQLTANAIVEICEESQVKELVLSPQHGPEWQAWIRSDFSSVYQDARHTVYLSHAIQP